METLQELEKQYNEAKKQRNWQMMAAIMLKVYPEHHEQPKQKSGTKKLNQLKI
jgi:hypothetical protein